MLKHCWERQEGSPGVTIQVNPPPPPPVQGDGTGLQAQVQHLSQNGSGHLSLALSPSRAAAARVRRHKVVTESMLRLRAGILVVLCQKAQHVVSRVFQFVDNTLELLPNILKATGSFMRNKRKCYILK